MFFTTAQIAKEVKGEILGDAAINLTGFAPAENAREGDLTFAENEEYFKRAEQSAAAAILAPEPFVSTVKTVIRVRNARIAYARVLPLFFPPEYFAPGIHPTASVASSAKIATTAHIGPCCVVGERAQIGAHTVLKAGNYVGPDCEIGDDVVLHPNVVIYSKCKVGNRVSIHAGAVIGADGFGYVLDEGKHRKVPQIGNVIIHDDVEIGANTTIDRAALGSTVIGKGTKIDNLVMLAHNVSVGENCIIISQVGVAGSTKIGNYSVLAGQVGIAGHLKIGNQVTIAAQSGVMRDIPDGQKMLGSPAIPDKEAKRQWLAVARLPELLRKVAELEKKIEKLTNG